MPFSLGDIAVTTIKVLKKTPQRSKPYERGVIKLRKEKKWLGTKSVAFSAIVKSLFRQQFKIYDKKYKAVYSMVIRFYGVDVDEDPKMIPSLTKHGVRVKCTCPAYFFYWGFANVLHRVYEGKPKAAEKTIPPEKKNKRKIPGMCKHLLALSRVLVAQGKIRV